MPVAKPGLTTNVMLPVLPNTHFLPDTARASGVYNTPFTFMASNYYTNSLGFFCKKELQVEKTLKFPVKFRLGSVEYTDKMEGKGAVFLQQAGKR